MSVRFFFTSEFFSHHRVFLISRCKLIFYQRYRFQSIQGAVGWSQWSFQIRHKTTLNLCPPEQGLKIGESRIKNQRSSHDFTQHLTRSGVKQQVTGPCKRNAIVTTLNPTTILKLLFPHVTELNVFRSYRVCLRPPHRAMRVGWWVLGVVFFWNFP